MRGIPSPFENPRPPLDNEELERRLEDFVQSSYGRADYGIGTYESMMYLTQKLVDMEVNDIRVFYKTLDYMIDIWDQGIASSNLRRDHRSEEGHEGELFNKLREKIVKLLLTFQIDLENQKQIDMLKGMYYDICPDDASLIDRFYWRLRYGPPREISGGIPDTVPPKEVVAYIRKKVSNL